jgi:glyoxylase-like metal-dependent hydrolase (beta-lactamase superfamily II)
VELREIERDVYACLQEDRGLGYSNSGLVTRGGGLVVDTFWDLRHTRELIESYARVWREPARHVVNTHHNGDHCWGNQLFPEAEIIGHRLCAEAMLEEAPELMQVVRSSSSSPDPVVAALAERLADWDFAGIELTPPTTLIEDRLDLNLDGTPVQIIYLGPAHTQGDVIVHLPEQHVVFSGDILFWRCTPIGWQGTYATWFAALDHITGLEPGVIVPGHGPLGPSPSDSSSTWNAPIASSGASPTMRRSTRWPSSARCTSCICCGGVAQGADERADTRAALSLCCELGPEPDGGGARARSRAGRRQGVQRGLSPGSAQLLCGSRHAGAGHRHLLALLEGNSQNPLGGDRHGRDPLRGGVLPRLPA